MTLAAGAAAAAVALCACEKLDYLPPDPVVGWPTRVLMHRGGGSNGPYRENTLPAVLYGASLLDGAEMDIQLSASRTLWLGHDNEVHDCAGTIVGCFQDLDDAALDALASCFDPVAAETVQHYVRLDEVLAAVTVAHPTDLFSLDVKGQYCGTGIVDAAVVMADEVNRLVRLHGMEGRVAVESDQRPFVERIVANGAPVHSFVVSLGDIDAPLSAAADLGASGISFKYAPTSEPLDARVVAGIHRVGQRIIVWTVNEPADIAAVWAAQPDVVETDDPDFMSHVPP